VGFRLKLTEDRIAALQTKLPKMIGNALSDRSQIEAEWQRNNDQYDGKVTISDHPWPGASNFFVPLSETYTNAVAGRTTDAIHGPEPTFTVHHLNPAWVDTARAVQDWIEYRMRETLQLRKFSEKYMLTLAKHGTAFAMLPHQVLLEKRLEYDIELDDVIQNIDTKIAGPALIRPRLQDFLVPKQAETLRSSPWMAHRVMLTEDDLMVRQFSGIYQEEQVKKVLESPQTQPDEATRRETESQGFSTTAYDPFFEIWEWWGLFHLPGHKFATWIIVPMHLPTKTPLSGLVNFYPTQMNPFFFSNFQPNESGIYGRGICRMARSGNLEVNKLHKHRVDNAMVANTRMFTVKSGLFQTLGKKFKIWPGRMVPVGEHDDFQAVPIADTYRSTQEEELLTRRTLEQLVGLSDFSLSSGGGEGLKRVGATAALTAVQESGRVLNARLNHIRTMYAELAAWVLEMDAHFRPMEEIRQVLGEKAAQSMLAMFEAPVEAVRGHMIVELTASSATVNREMSKQSDILLVNIMSTYAQRYFQIAQLVLQPEIPDQLKQVGLSISKMMNELMRDILRDFDKRNDALVLAELEDVVRNRFNSLESQPAAREVAGTAGSTQAELIAAASAREGLGDEGRVLGSLLGT
jgi:hypothetical protein